LQATADFTRHHTHTLTTNPNQNNTPMDFQTSLTEHVLTLATAVVSEATSHQLQENNILDQVKRIFQGRLKTTTSDSTLLSGSSEKNEGKQTSLNASACFEQKYDDNKEQYYVFIVLSDEVFSASPHTTPAPPTNMAPTTLDQYPQCKGCTIILPKNELNQHSNENKTYVEISTKYNRSWFTCQLMEQIEKHFSWNDMMQDELMEDDEYQSEMLDAVIEELDAVSTITLPPNCEAFENEIQHNSQTYLEYLDKVWKLSHTLKTTARLVGGNQLESQSEMICSMLRPVVRGGAKLDSLKIDGETLYNRIQKFVSSILMLNFLINHVIQLKR